MSDLTAELNLALAVDDDDTADYLTQTAGLRGSLQTIDGLFSSTTGHNHSGAHQGGGFTSLNLSGALTVAGNLTVGGTAAISGATTVLSLDVATTSALHGAVTMGSTLTVSGLTTLSGGVTNLAATGYVSAGPVISAAAGDLNANRSNNTGYVFLGNASHYVGFDGTQYVLPSAWLWVNAERVVTEVAAETLYNKTIISPSGDGNMTATGGAAQRLETGTASSASLTSPSGSDNGVTFSRAFASPPRVLVALATSGGQDIANKFAGVTTATVTTSGFQWRAYYNGGGSGTVSMNWIAIGS